jgi:hypothetical protein
MAKAFTLTFVTFLPRAWAAISSSLIAFRTWPKGAFSNAERKMIHRAATEKLKIDYLAGLSNTCPSMLGLGIPVTPDAPPVSEVRLLIVSNRISWKAKVDRTK